MDAILIRDLDRDDINKFYQSLVSLCENCTPSRSPMADAFRGDNFSLKFSIESVKSFSFNDFNEDRFTLHLVCLENISVRISTEIVVKHLKFLLCYLSEAIFSMTFDNSIIECLRCFTKHKIRCDEAFHALVARYIEIADILKSFRYISLKISSTEANFDYNWKNIIQISLMKARQIEDAFLIEKTIKSIKIWIMTMQYEDPFTQSLFGFIDTFINTTIRHSEIISRDIDHSLFSSCFRSFASESISPTKDLEGEAMMANTLAINYENIFQRSNEDVRATQIHSQPHLDSILCLFLNEFLKIYPKKQVQDHLAKHYERNPLFEISFKLFNTINQFFEYPLDLACSLAELLCCISEENKTLDMLDYVIFEINRGLPYRKLSINWSTHFLSQSQQPPFLEILTKFNKSSTPLETLLQNATSGIYLIKFPKQVYGYTSKQQQIILNLFNENFGVEGATFVVYLHELAHYLQRVDCPTVASCMERKSDEFEEKEGGRALEKQLFGDFIMYLTEDAANFAIGSESTQSSSINNFQEVFKKKNSIQPDSRIISLNKSMNIIFLGKCGSSYGNIFTTRHWYSDHPQ